MQTKETKIVDCGKLKNGNEWKIVFIHTIFADGFEDRSYEVQWTDSPVDHSMRIFFDTEIEARARISDAEIEGTSAQLNMLAQLKTVDEVTIVYADTDSETDRILTHVEFGTDSRGRSIGMRIAIYEVITPIHRFAAYIRQTRDGKTFGPYQPERYFDTQAEREIYISNRIAKNCKKFVIAS